LFQIIPSAGLNYFSIVSVMLIYFISKKNCLNERSLNK